MKRTTIQRRSSSLAAVFETIEPRAMLTVLASIETGGSDGRQVSVTPTVVSGVTSSLFTRGSDTNYRAASSSAPQLYSMYGVPRQSDNRYGLTEAEGVTRGHYFQFTVTPDSGKQLSLSQFDFAPYVENGTKGANIAVEYRVGGSGSFSTAWTGTTFVTGGPVTFKSATLSSVTALQNVTSSVDFRIIFWSIGQTGFGSSPSTILTYSSTSIGLHSGGDVEVQGTVTDVTPVAPSALHVKSILRSIGNTLSWTDNSSNETGFAIDRATNVGFTTGLTTFSVGANVTQTTDDLSAIGYGTVYYYRVRAINGAAASSNSTTASHLTMNKLDPVTYAIYNPTNTGEPTANVQTDGSLGALPLDLSTENIDATLAAIPSERDTIVLDIEAAGVGHEDDFADAIAYMIGQRPGQYIGYYGAPYTQYYFAYYMQYPEEFDPVTVAGKAADWDALDATYASIVAAENLVVPWDYFLGTASGPQDTAADLKEDYAIATQLTLRAKAEAGDKPVAVYLNPYRQSDTFNATYGFVSQARWEATVQAVKDAGADSVVLWGYGIPWSTWQPYAEAAEDIMAD